MRIIQATNYEDMSKKASDIISAIVLLKPHCVLGLATGSTPIGTYKQLIKKYQSGELDFSNVSSVNLDEYKGLSGTHEQSYRYFMNTHFFDHININKEHTFVPNGLATDIDSACQSYNAVIEQFPQIDLQLLGIGGNGHIGFNEPSTEFKKTVHCVALTKDTIEANSRFFEREEDVPKHAYTMGIGNIMSANTILLLASGASKAQAIYDSFFGPITPQVPGSILQLHSNVIVIADQDALSIAKQKGVIA